MQDAAFYLSTHTTIPKIMILGIVVFLLLAFTCFYSQRYSAFLYLAILRFTQDTYNMMPPRKYLFYSRGGRSIFSYASVKSPSLTQPIFLKNRLISGHKTAGKIIAISASPIQSVLVMAVLTPAAISSTHPV